MEKLYKNMNIKKFVDAVLPGYKEVNNINE